MAKRLPETRSFDMIGLLRIPSNDGLLLLNRSSHIRAFGSLPTRGAVFVGGGIRARTIGSGGRTRAESLEGFVEARARIKGTLVARSIRIRKQGLLMILAFVMRSGEEFPTLGWG